MPKSRNDYCSVEVQALISSARNGEASSVGNLLQIYRNYLSILAKSQFKQRLKPRVSPSDVVQEALLCAHKRFDQFQGQTEKELVAWLRVILVNSLAKFVERHVLTKQRDLRRDVSIDKFGSAMDNSAARVSGFLAAKDKTPSVMFQQREDAIGLADQLAKLSEEHRQVLVLRNLQELPFEEIAKRMNRSGPATRMLWLRALDKLRNLYLDPESQSDKENHID